MQGMELPIQDVFARVEKKFILNEEQAAAMVDGLTQRGFFLMDFGSPAVQSIYYDTWNCALIRASLERPNYKEKFRLRAYGHPGPDSQVFLECKKKYQDVVYKRRTGLLLREAEAAMDKGIWPLHCGQIGRELAFSQERYGLSPRALILYDRDAYMSNQEQEVRVTFDRGVRYRMTRLDVTAPQEGTQLLPAGSIVMEVKHPGAYPLWLIRLIEQCGVRGTHLSKYGMAYLRERESQPFLTLLKEVSYA